MRLVASRSAEDGCIRALRDAFSAQVSDVSVKPFGKDCYTVRFVIDDQVFACIATSGMPGFSKPEFTMFLAESFAYASESEWLMIDGYSPARRPQAEIRVGTAEEIAPLVAEAAHAFLDERSIKAACAP